ncbi:ferredoxin [Kribbella sp. NPDC050124]|uniref:ferredoxin n=1 Tax=Kribbella sp. NPDC050124 TaxID=3364114 RepID=UPI0037AFAF43
MTLWKVTVDRDACIGSGMCLGIAADHFELGPDRRSRPVSATVDADEPAALDLASAAECCPGAAITVVAAP